MSSEAGRNASSAEEHEKLLDAHDALRRAEEHEKLLDVHAAVPHHKRKRNTLSMASVCYALLMGNVEYAIVMPSLFLYLRTLDPHVPEYYFGIIMGGFNLASMAASPFFGYWMDKRPMKEILIFCMFVGVIGNSVYAFAPNVYVVLLGRLISGVGGNVYNCGMTYVIRVSDVEERSALTAKVLLIFYLGMLFGPALNYPLSLLGRYKFGLFTLQSLNSPGLLMVFMLLLAVVALHLFFEEPIAVDELKSAEFGPDAHKCCGLAKYRPLFTSFTLMSVITLQFLVQFNQIILETVVTPLTNTWYDFGQLQNSLVYAVITAIFFVWFAVIIVVSKYVQDRTLIVMGATCFGLCFIGAVAVFYSTPDPDTVALPFWVFCVLVTLLVSGIPFFLSSMSSLFSKLVGDKRIQGMAQSMLGASNSLANILGPTIAGFILPRTDRIFAMLLGAWGIIMIILVVRWRAFSSAKEPAAEAGPVADHGHDTTTTTTTTTITTSKGTPGSIQDAYE